MSIKPLMAALAATFITAQVSQAAELCEPTSPENLHVNCDLTTFCEAGGGVVGVVADGTDQTANIQNCIQYRLRQDATGFLTIPYNVKYDIQTIISGPGSTLPDGIVLKDDSQINWGHTVSTKQKVVAIVSRDDQYTGYNNDTNLQVVSGHHPSIILNNFGTSGSVSADERFMSIIFANGQLASGEHDTAMYMQVRNNAASENQWVWNVMNDSGDTMFQVREDGKTYADGNFKANGYVASKTAKNMNQVPACAPKGAMIFLTTGFTSNPRPVWHEGSGKWVDALGTHQFTKACP